MASNENLFTLQEVEKAQNYDIFFDLEENCFVDVLVKFYNYPPTWIEAKIKSKNAYEIQVNYISYGKISVIIK